jgi:hypothetical protein
MMASNPRQFETPPLEHPARCTCEECLPEVPEVRHQHHQQTVEEDLEEEGEWDHVLRGVQGAVRHNARFWRRLERRRDAALEESRRREAELQQQQQQQQQHQQPRRVMSISRDFLEEERRRRREAEQQQQQQQQQLQQQPRTVVGDSSNFLNHMQYLNIE